MSEAAQRKEKQKWAIEKPKLDNNRRLRGIHFIDPADAEFKELLKMREESWKFRCQQQCRARSGEESTRKLVALLMLARQNTHASLTPAYLRESVWNELYKNIMKTTLQGKELNHYNLVHKCILVPKAMKYQMRKQQWTKNGKNWRRYRHGS